MHRRVLVFVRGSAGDGGRGSVLEVHTADLSSLVLSDSGTKSGTGNGTGT